MALPSSPALLAELLRVLRPDGKLVLDEPHAVRTTSGPAARWRGEGASARGGIESPLKLLSLRPRIWSAVSRAFLRAQDASRREALRGALLLAGFVGGEAGVATVSARKPSWKVSPEHCERACC